jgi:hypothetical protein
LTSTTPAFGHPSSAEEGIICRFSFVIHSHLKIFRFVPGNR